jgi:acetylornithine deacetylase/succinyl-diaminopimelate desuccinylase family protein
VALETIRLSAKFTTHDKDAFDAVSKTIDAMREEIIALCSKLVQMQSVNPKYPGSDAEKYLGGEKECNEFLVSQLSTFGCDVDLFEKSDQRTNLVGTLEGSGGGKSLIMNGHIDTVPFGNPELWKDADPLSGKVRDGLLFGRGACDMKSGIAAMCKAAEAISRSGIALKGDLYLESVVGEETMDHLLGSSYAIERGYKADAAIITEPTSLSLNPVTQGVLLMTVRVEGKTVHTTSRDKMIRPGGGGDEIGVNAIEKGVKVLQALQELEVQWGITKTHPLYDPGHFVIHPGVIDGAPSGHRYVAVVPDYCTIDYAILYNPSETTMQVKEEIEGYVMTASKLDTWLSKHPPKFSWWGEWPAGQIGVNDPICKSVELGHHLALNGQANVALKGMPAPVDVPFLDAAGIPTIAYGPGNLAQAHIENEYVPIDQLIVATKALAFAAMNFCGFSIEKKK